MLRRTMHDTLQADWKQSRSTPALACVVAIATSLGVGLIVGRPGVGMVAAGGAMSVGFGAFQRLGRSRTGPMFWGAIGMSVFTLIGSVIGHGTPAVILNALAVGLFYGWMTALGPGASWIALQCGAFALVATGYPSGALLALGRAALVLVGGFLQLGLIVLFRRLCLRFNSPTPPDAFRGMRAAPGILREKCRAPFQERSLRVAPRRGSGCRGRGRPHFCSF